jgi:heme-degrading monooxygenase HmoA
VFARMTIMMVRQDRIDEAIKVYTESVVPAAKKQKGYRGACLLTNLQEGKGISVTFWDSRRDAEANEDNLYYQEQLAKFLDMFSGPPIREGYDVAVHRLLEKKGAARPAPKRPVRKK